MKLLNKNQVILKDNICIRDAIKLFNKNAKYTNYKGFGVVTNKKGKCLATVTDGDLRRSLEKKNLNTPIKKIANYNFKYILDYYSDNRIIREFENLAQKGDRNILTLPVVNKKKIFLGYLNYNDLLSLKNKKIKNNKKNVKVIVPGRLSFSGGGLDFSDIINKKEIYVLSVPINRFIKINIFTREDSKINVFQNKKKIFSANFSKIEEYKKKNFILSIIYLMKPSSGMNIKIVSEIEGGSGLGGSSALTVGLISAIHYIKYNEKIEANDLANYAYLIERMKLGIVGGWQDFYGTIFSGYKFISFNNDDVKVKSLILKDKIKKELEKNLIFFKFGKKRSSSKIQEKRKNLNKIRYTLNKMNLNTKKIKHYLLNGNLKKLGIHILNSWDIKKKINPETTNSLIDQAIDTSISLGAYGGKVLGAGKSGYLMILSKNSYHEKIKKKLNKKFKYLPIKPIEKGIKIREIT